MQDVQGDTDQCEGCGWVSKMSIDCQKAARCQEGGGGQGLGGAGAGRFMFVWVRNTWISLIPGCIFMWDHAIKHLNQSRARRIYMNAAQVRSRLASCFVGGQRTREHLKRLTMDFFSISVFCFKKTKQKTCHNSLTTPSIACVCSSGLAHLIISAPRWFPGHYCCSKKKKKKDFQNQERRKLCGRSDLRRLFEYAQIQFECEIAWLINFESIPADVCRVTPATPATCSPNYMHLSWKCISLMSAFILI